MDGDFSRFYITNHDFIDIETRLKIDGWRFKIVFLTFRHPSISTGALRALRRIRKIIDGDVGCRAVHVHSGEVVEKC